MDEKRKTWGGARHGAGRPKAKEAIAKRSISIPQSWELWLEQEAQKRGVTVSKLIQEALDSHFNLSNKPLEKSMGKAGVQPPLW